MPLFRVVGAPRVQIRAATLLLAKIRAEGRWFRERTDGGPTGETAPACWTANPPTSKGGGASECLGREIQPEAEDKDRGDQGHGIANVAQTAAARKAIETAAGEHHHEADARHDTCHAQPEGDDKNESEGSSTGRDRAEEDEQRAGRRDEAAGQTQDEEAAPGDGGAGGWQVGVADTAVGVLARIVGLARTPLRRDPL